MGFSESGKLGQPSIQLVHAQRCPLSHRRGLHIQREVCGQVSRQAPGPVGAGEAGDGGQQRAIVLQRLGHLVIEALVVLAFDSVVVKLDSFGDQQSRAGPALVVAEEHGGCVRCCRRQSGETP
jgi:hypothetical protein